MKKKRIEDIVTELVVPIANALSFELVDVEFLKEGVNWYLRVYIDKLGGIAIDDCQAVSEKLSYQLDEVDPIKQSYILEVSSPGLERPLKKDSDFERFKGADVEVRLFQPLNGKKNYEGIILGIVEDKIVIRQTNGEELKFDRADTAMVRRALKF